MLVSAIDDPPSTTFKPYSCAAAFEQMTAISAAPLELRSIAHCAELGAGSHANDKDFGRALIQRAPGRRQKRFCQRQIHEVLRVRGRDENEKSN